LEVWNKSRYKTPVSIAEYAMTAGMEILRWGV
jgi:hypothetical protein